MNEYDMPDAIGKAFVINIERELREWSKINDTDSYTALMYLIIRAVSAAYKIGYFAGKIKEIVKRNVITAESWYNHIEPQIGDRIRFRDISKTGVSVRLFDFNRLATTNELMGICTIISVDRYEYNDGWAIHIQLENGMIGTCNIQWSDVDTVEIK